MRYEAETFAHNFPNSTIPTEFVPFFNFDQSMDGWYSGRFELSLTTYGDPAFFGGDAAAAEQFAVFGEGPDGSLYAYWLYDGRSIQDAPIVFLGSEGVDCAVLANDLQGLLSLLALGEAELGFSAAMGKFAGPPYDEDIGRLNTFREWLEREFGVQALSDPVAIIRAARQRHPDLQVWLEAWQEQQFGSSA